MADLREGGSQGTMRAVRVQAPGGPDALRYEDVPVPEPGPGQVRVRVVAAGVNFIDIYLRTGQYPAPMPLTLGMEGAGTVEAVGAGVSQPHPGARVAFVVGNGAYAEFAIVPADRAVPLPPDVDERQAAAAMLQGMTAHYLGTSTFALASEDACLVHAAAGGVGLLLCQIARKRGARVIGTTSTEEKAELARRAGADAVILYTREDTVTEVQHLTDRRGVQVVYDSVGRTTFEQSLDCLAPRGMLVLFGQSSGAVAPLDPQVLSRKGSLFLTRPTLAHYTATREELLQRAGDVLAWVRNGELELRIDRELPLSEAATAHRLLESRQTAGKLLLIPS